MASKALYEMAEDYNRDGFLSPVDLISPEKAAEHRRRMEEAEGKIGNLHYQSKVHTILTSPLELVMSEKVLDIVEAMIGPDVLLYNSTCIIKEPHSPSHVSWHQDLTY